MFGNYFFGVYVDLPQLTGDRARGGTFGVNFFETDMGGQILTEFFGFRGVKYVTMSVEKPIVTEHRDAVSIGFPSFVGELCEDIFESPPE